MVERETKDVGSSVGVDLGEEGTNVIGVGVSSDTVDVLPFVVDILSLQTNSKAFISKDAGCGDLVALW